MFHLIIPELTEEESQKLRPYLQAKVASVGELLTEQGEDTRDLLFIFQGKYDVYQKVTLIGQSVAVKIAHVEPPVLFGEGSLFSCDNRSATVLTTEEGKYFQLPYEKFVALRKEEPAIALKLLDYAGHVIFKRYNDVRSTVYDNIIQNAKTADQSLELLGKYIGEARLCDPELAEKLFGKDKK